MSAPSSLPPSRLRDEATGLERELIEAWSSVRGPEHGRRRALGLLGAGASVAAATAASTIASAASAPSAVAPSAAASISLLVKGAALAVLTCVIVATGVVLSPSPPPPTATPATPTAPSPQRLAAPVELVPIPVDSLPLAPAPAPAPAPASASAPAPASLAAELAELDSVHEALDSGHPDRALAALDRFAARHATSALGEEASALRVDIHVARGDRASAARAARNFLARYPASPYAARVQRASDPDRDAFQ